VILRLRERVLELGDGPLIAGIVNIGEDSVAERLHLRTLGEQLAYARSQLDLGAHIVDVGVQSGRTDTATISEEEELERLAPLVRALAAQRVPVSVETWRPAVAAGVLQAGAAIINDVSGLADPALADLAAESGAALVVMHTRARPKEERFPDYADPMADVLEFLGERCALAREHGVEDSQLILDPGLDFAKTPAQSVEVLRRLHELKAFERPVLLAVSRKYFIGVLTAKTPEERLAGTLAALEYGIAQGAQIVRVHDVGAVVEFLDVRGALHGSGEPKMKGDPAAVELKWLDAKSA